MASFLRLDEMTRDGLREMAPRATVVLPAASTEQHGPHLPLQTDRALTEAVALRAVETAGARVPVVLAPTLAFGSSHHHLVYAALSLRSSTFIAVLNDLADSLVGAGFRRLFVLNGHGGNDECVKLLAKDLVLRSPVAIAAASYWDVGGAAARVAGEAGLKNFPGHSGGFETALMMAVAPQLVRLDRLPSGDPNPPRITGREVASGVAVQKGGEWERIGGYTDSPTGATAELGNRLLAAIADAVADALVAFHKAAG